MGYCRRFFWSGGENDSFFLIGREGIEVFFGLVERM